jgi:hypothetical protein
MSLNLKSKREAQMQKSYSKLIGMGLIHLIIMYFLMFSMVYGWPDVFMNLNTFYMAGMMAAPMVLFMPLMMPSMYKNKTWNALCIGGSSVLLVVFFLFIRAQTFVGDQQFIRSMIPHHSGAILMCERANIKDAELKALCGEIIKSQREEIEEMKQIFARMRQDE